MVGGLPAKTDPVSLPMIRLPLGEPLVFTPNLADREVARTDAYYLSVGPFFVHGDV